MSEFARQILVNVIDKVVLGGVLLLGGHLLNQRELSSSAHSEPLESEFLRERTKRLDELYTLMLDLDVAADHFHRGER